MSRLRLLFVALSLLTTSVACETASPPLDPVDAIGRPDPTHGAITDDDIDGDGIANDADNCPSLANADQRDVCAYEFPAPEPTGDATADGIARLNFWREILGLGTVDDDPALTAGCQAHIDYMQAVAAEMGEPFVILDEQDPAHASYTAEGAMAAESALLGYGYPDAASAVNGWLDLVFHRLPLIHPGLTRVGLAYDARYFCIRVDEGTDTSAVAPHPILWPPGDSAFASPVFRGGELPCANVGTPTTVMSCDPGALIPSLGLHGHTISGVSASMARTDTGEQVEILHALHAGGSTPVEMGGLVAGSIVIAPPAGSEIAPTEYEVRVAATVDGMPEEYRWRFRAGPAISQELPCDVFGRTNFSFERAVDVTAATFRAQLCEQPMFYRVREAGSWRITLDYDPRYGDLELIAYDASRAEIGHVAENDGREQLDGVPGMGFVEVRGAGGATGGYVLLVEPN
ncbi:MAG: thrombospondin type 3 repeat-containing protein [Myxococcota bacterium]|nr:thrombospondin type 3 repeat-containing protein [Myxococcota bacterium]